MTRDDIITMAREADREWDCDRDMVEWLEWFATLVAAAERETFYGQDKPDACRNGCPIGQVCDYCQIVAPIQKMIAKAVAAEREACAKVVEASPSYDWHRFACEAAAAIRARGETT